MTQSKCLCTPTADHLRPALACKYARVPYISVHVY